MHVLVTGGAGFIGCNFVRALLNHGHSVRVLDKLTYASSPYNLKNVATKISLIKGDITKKSDVVKSLNNIDAVVNFAAETHVDNSIRNPEKFINTNVFGTYTLLEAARKSNIQRFVHISTDEVYGSSTKGRYKETDTLDPRNPYSATKAAAEHLVMAYVNTYGLNSVISRSSNNYGPYQNPEKFIPRMITRAIQNKPLPVYGKGLNIRDWIYVEDNCAAILRIMEKGKSGETYNISSGDEKQNIIVTKLILKTLKKPELLIRFVKDRPGHDFRYAIDSKKIRRLGWKPQNDFETGLKKTIGWYLSNRYWQKI